MSEPFIGQVQIWACNFAPRGWAFCNGTLLPIAQNTALFSLYGTIYGGDGRTTFALPDLQGRSAMHPGRGPGLTSRQLGQRVGAETITLVESQIPSHNHLVNASDAAGTVDSPADAYPAKTGPLDREYSVGTAQNTNFNSNAIANSGSGQGHNNMQPYLALNFCSALVGLFPSRS